MLSDHRTGVNCPECGGNERKSKVKDGKCRDCRGVEKPKRIIPNNRWNDSGEAKDHREQYNRQRIIDNDR
jgi:hypothetical protein